MIRGSPSRRRPARTTGVGSGPFVAPRGSRRGFTLFSMIVALVLLAAGVSSLATANARTVTLQTLAQNRTNAVALARGYVERLRTRDPWTLQSESPIRLNAEGTAAAGGAYLRTVTVTILRHNLVRVEVRIDFPRSTQPLLLTTSVFRGNGLSGAG
jgi:type IV pilus assembly protein PilV